MEEVRHSNDYDICHINIYGFFFGAAFSESGTLNAQKGPFRVRLLEGIELLKGYSKQALLRHIVGGGSVETTGRVASGTEVCSTEWSTVASPTKIQRGVFGKLVHQIWVVRKFVLRIRRGIDG